MSTCRRGGGHPRGRSLRRATSIGQRPIAGPGGSAGWVGFRKKEVDIKRWWLVVGAPLLVFLALGASVGAAEEKGPKKDAAVEDAASKAGPAGKSPALTGPAVFKLDEAPAFGKEEGAAELAAEQKTAPPVPAERSSPPSAPEGAQRDKLRQSPRKLAGVQVLSGRPVESAPGVVAKLPTPAGILKELRARRESVENLRVEATWEEYENGKPSAWEDSAIYCDDLGRIRDRYFDGQGALPSGPRVPGGAHMRDELFNGEITVKLVDDPTRNHLGGPFQAGDDPDSKRRYRCALVYDGKFQMGSHRNPFTYMDAILIPDLSRLLAGGKAVTVGPAGGQQDVYELRYRFDPKDDPDRLEHRVLVDAGKGWVVTRHEQFFPDGKSARLTTCDYKRADRGLWVPTKGKVWNLWGKDVPDRECRFTVRRVVANDPAFDERVFDVKLERGVYVSDTPHHASYWLEEDVVSGSDLTRLARDALAKQSARVSQARDGSSLAGPAVGHLAPDFRIDTMDGRSFSLREQRGKFVLLHFWATRLPLDEAELSILKDTQRKFARERQLAVLGLCVGTREDIRRVAQQKDMSWPQARMDVQSQERIARDYGTLGFGLVILIGPDGNVLLKRRAGAVDIHPTVRELLE